MKKNRWFKALCICTIFKNSKNLFIDYLIHSIGLPFELIRPYKLKTKTGLSFSVFSWEQLGPYYSIWERAEYGSLNLNGEGCILDLGANIGLFSLYAAYQNPGRLIYAYEPAPENLNLLQKNLRQNGILYCVVKDQAVSDQSGSAEFGVCSKFKSQSHSLDKNTGKTILVQTISLEDLIEQLEVSCQFMKMDIEGAEYKALMHCSRKNLKKIHEMFIECHSVPEYTPEDLHQYLSDTGLFDVKLIDLSGCKHIHAILK
jgi:FkbM family methyltransferase